MSPRQPSMRLKTGAPSPSKPGDHYRVNTFYTSLDKVLALIEIRLNENDQVVLCALKVTMIRSPVTALTDLDAR